MTFHKSKIQAKNFKFLLILILVSFIIFNLPFLNRSGNIGSVFRNERLEKNPKISQLSKRIHIDNNWSEAKIAGICTGLGTYGDPYIIQDLFINGNGTGNGITITSKNDYFRIENCTILIVVLV